MSKTIHTKQLDIVIRICYTFDYNLGIKNDF